MVFSTSLIARLASCWLVIGIVLGSWTHCWSQEPVQDSISDQAPPEFSLSDEASLAESPPVSKSVKLRLHDQSRRKESYFEADYLLWWSERSILPPLVTTNSPGTPLANAGPVGSPGSSVLMGNQIIGDWPHSGLRLRYGFFPVNSNLSRMELSVWHLFEGQTNFSQGSDSSGGSGSTILARPFFNTATNQNDAQMLSFPGLVNGGLQSDYDRQAFGVDPLAFICLASDGCRWTEFYTGYRYIKLHDSFNMDERIETTAGGLIGPGVGFRIQDSFEANNGYHLIPIGLSFSGNRGKSTWNIRGDVGLGFVNQTVEVYGLTQILDNGAVAETYNAGLLALGTNSGRHHRTRFAWVPQLSFNWNRRLSQRLVGHVGYNLICLNEAVKAVDHIPTMIDPGNIPPTLPGSGPEPRFGFRDDSALLHGFSFGLRLNF